ATNYGIYVVGRSVDQKVRSVVSASNSINSTATSYVDMPNMSMTVTAQISAYFLVFVQINGVQAAGGNIGAYFRLLIDGAQSDFPRQEFHNNGWELRGVTLTRLIALGAGSHTVSVQWMTTGGGTLEACLYGDSRQVQVIEL